MVFVNEYFVIVLVMFKYLGFDVFFVIFVVKDIIVLYEFIDIEVCGVIVDVILVVGLFRKFLWF